MNRIRLASLVAAAVITATQWVPFFGPLPPAPTLRLLAVRVLDDVAARGGIIAASLRHS
jgi:hypothetical protein